MSQTMHEEPILKENKDRFVLFPIRNMKSGNSINRLKPVSGRQKK